MRYVLLVLLTATLLQAGVIRGVVLERASGHALARTLVRLEALPRAGAGEIRSFQSRADISGTFAFLNVPGGLYLLVASREAYFPAAFGQRLPGGQGTAVEVTRESDLFAELRMVRKGAVTGRVVDENGIGTPDVTVIAYRARLPLRTAGHAVSDDRGVYRIYGLDPGKYWVRTASRTLEDGSGMLPTFGPESREAHDAGVYRVNLEDDTVAMEIRPFHGSLFRVHGRVVCGPLPTPPVNVALSSETGRRFAQVLCGGEYTFDGLAPAFYEVYASARAKPSMVSPKSRSITTWGFRISR